MSNSDTDNDNVLKQMDKAVAQEAEKMGLKLHVDVMQDYYFHRDNPEHTSLHIPEIADNQDYDEEDTLLNLKGMDLNELMAEFESYQAQEQKIVLPMVLKCLGLSFGLFLPAMSVLGTSLQHHFGENVAWLNMLILLTALIGTPSILIGSVFWQSKKKRSILGPLKAKMEALRIRIISEGEKAIAQNKNRDTDNGNGNSQNKQEKDIQSQDFKLIDVHNPIKIFDMIRYQFSKTDGPEVSVDNGGIIDEYYETKLNLEHAKNNIIKQGFWIGCAFLGVLTLLCGGITYFCHYHDKITLFLSMMKTNVFGSILMWIFITAGLMSNNSTLDRLKNRLTRQKEAISRFKQKLFKS